MKRTTKIPRKKTSQNRRKTKIKANNKTRKNYKKTKLLSHSCYIHIDSNSLENQKIKYDDKKRQRIPDPV